jgi:fatty acid desaturase
MGLLDRRPGYYGLSFGWWVPKHNAHHAHPNEMGRDPDIGEGAALALSDAPGNGRGPLASWLARWQAPLFFPLMLLRSGGMHVLGIQRLVPRRDHASAVEASLPPAARRVVPDGGAVGALPAQGTGFRHARRP